MSEREGATTLAPTSQAAATPGTSSSSLAARGISWTDEQSVGELSLRIDTKAGRSYARAQYHRGALRILRPRYADDSGQVGYVVINPGGGYLGSDTYDLDIIVEPGASLLLTTQSATKVYRTPQGPATQRMQVTLGEGATFESMPDQLIVYREGSYIQHTDVRMHLSASLFLAEVVTPGWDPAGAAFGYDELRLRTSITETTSPHVVHGPGADPLAGTDRLWAVDQLRIVPAVGDVTGIGFMEGHSHAGQVLVADGRVTDALVDEIAALVAATGLRAGISRIGRPRPRDADTGERAPGLEGFAVRALAHSTEPLTALHLDVANLLRARWRGQPPVDPRKY